MIGSLDSALPPAQVHARLSAHRTPADGLDRDALRALYEANRGAPWEEFFHEAWHQDLAPAAARLWFDVRGRTDDVLVLPRLEVGDDEILIHPGHLRVEGAIFNRGMLFVSGDVDVGGELGDDDVGRLTVVEGSVCCRLSNTQGGLRVGGDLVAATLVFGNYHEDGIVVGGALRAPLTILLMGKRIEAARLETRLVRRALSIREAVALRAALVPAVVRDLDLDGPEDDEIDLEALVDIDALYRMASDGDPVLRTGSGGSASLLLRP